MGLLGASLAKELDDKYTVFGCDNNPEHIDYLQSSFRVTETQSDIFYQYLLKADIVVIATPVETAYSIFNDLKQFSEKGLIKENLIVTDLASTKGDLMNYYNNNTFPFLYAGSHPMAGSDLSGPHHSKKDMFNGATIYISPPAQESIAVDVIFRLWEKIGARPYIVPHDEHDRWGAYLSHGLHLVSCMVSHLIDDIPSVYNVPSNAAGGSFRDITRVAGSNPQLWDGIIQSNKKEVLHYLKALKNLTEEWTQKLEQSEISVQEIFERAASIREKVIKNEN